MLHASERQQGARDFEDIVDSLGSFGHWQRVIFVLISLADVFGAFAMMLPVFTGATPRWRCAEYKTVADGSFRNGSDFGDYTWKSCDLEGNNLTCVSRQYHDDFTSIVSQV